jgi:hypothetical protein
MLRWLFKIFSPSTSQLAPQLEAGIDASRLEHLLRTPGRAHHSTLIGFAHSVSSEEFVSVFHCNALVGSAIREGELSKGRNRSQDILSSATFQFSPTEVAEFLEGRAIEQTIFLLRKEPDADRPSPPNRFTIGRSKDNDIRIVDFAISRLHAIIEYSSGKYRIKDCDSRNGTKINGRRIYSTPESLADGDVISLGRYEFTYLEPESLYKRLIRIGLPS